MAMDRAASAPIEINVGSTALVKRVTGAVYRGTLVIEGVTTVEGSMDGTNWTTLTGTTRAGTTEVFDVLGQTFIRCTGNGAKGWLLD